MGTKIFDDYFKGKKIIVSGNTGFKGSWLSLFLSKLGAEVYGVSSLNTSIDERENEFKLDNNCVFKQYDVDVRDYEGLFKCIEDVEPDYIFHLAARAITLESYKMPLETIGTNVMGTSNILEVVRIRNKPCKVVVITSDKCYENKNWIWGYRETDTLAGSDPYSASKSMAELVCKTYFDSFFKNSEEIKMATCRAGNVIGGGDWNPHRIVPDCIRSWKNNKPLIIRNPEAVRPWNYILDTLWGYILTAINIENEAVNGQSFNFGPNIKDEITVLELVDELWKSWGDDKFEPYQIQKSIEEDSKEHMLLKLNSEKAYRYLGWSSETGIRSSLEQTMMWYKHYVDSPETIAEFSAQQIDDYLLMIEK
mgnify:CR=1 FL=1